ncbi:MAG TPA: ATP-binding protein [Rhodocyclaceae bacterium]
MKRQRLDRHALVAALLYLILGGAWIAMSDRALQALIEDPARLTLFQTYKGWAFVAVMALLAYVLIARLEVKIRALHESERRLAESEAAKQALNEDLERRVAERTRALERANHDLESFAFSVSHDLRAPLRSLGGLAELLGEGAYGELNAEGLHLLGRIRANAHRMMALIDDILEFSRTASTEIRYAPTDMRALALGVTAELAPEHPRAAIEIGDLPEAIGDAAMLRQVWANLIGNALKFSSGRAEPRVWIDATAGGEGNPVYRVRDNGVGFDMAYAGRLFGVFQRMHRESDFPGTGAGLAIVKRIVERHGGRVWAEAEIDRGAVFHFTLAPFTNPGSA